MGGEYYRELLRPLVAGRRWIVAVDLLAAASATVDLLAELGADRSFVLTGSHGTGDPPDEAHAESVVLGTAGDTVMEAMRAAEFALTHLPAAVQARIDAWDPDRRARALTWFLASDVSVAGRPTYGARRPEWAALEDKTVVDELWDAAGVTRAPAEVVGAETGELLAASRRLDAGAGTVWVADNREGWHGGGEYLRWVRTREDAAAAAEFLSGHAGRVRVMPFLEGIPCSIHTMVFPDDIVAFNPVELVTLRRPGTSELVYASVAGFWEPPAADRDYMRSVARAAAAHLARSVGYRGAVCIDGVLTADGFLPTELNARLSIGLLVQLRAIDGLPGAMLNRALIEGEDLDYRPRELERVFQAAYAAGDRRGGCLHTVPRPVTETESCEVRFDGSAWSPAGEGEGADGTLTLGPSPIGGLVRIALDPDRTPKGPSVAPRVAAAMALADQLWDLGIGPLVAAPEVR